MRSRSNEEHENYKDELGDNDFIQYKYASYSTASEIENELFRSDYRPMLYDYYVKSKNEARRNIKEMLQTALFRLRSIGSRKF